LVPFSPIGWERRCISVRTPASSPWMWASWQRCALPAQQYVPQGALSERRKAGLVEEATKAVLAAADLAPDDALRVWVLVHEQPEGTWGAGGSVIRYADLVAVAKGQRTDA
ncbi:tautomerase family protein, partial [Streptomyces sp. NPDC001296]